MFTNKNEKGASLIELIMAIVIMSIALLGIVGVMSVSVKSSANPLTRKQAVLAAESLMDEVLSKQTVKPAGGFSGSYTTTNRGQFDAISDYNGLSILGISNISSISIPELSNYNATINVINQGIGTIPNADSKLVTINIIGPNDNFTLKGYRINYDN